MPKFVVMATLEKEFAIHLEADNEQEALQQLDDWIADDFDDFVINSKWDFDVLENE